MRRIAVLTLLLVPLCGVPARAAGGTACSDVTHNGHFATGIVEHGVGCAMAHGVVRHVIDHGTAGYHHWSCSRSFLPKNVTEWSCSYGNLAVKFGVRPL